MTHTQIYERLLEIEQSLQPAHGVDAMYITGQTIYRLADLIKELSKYIRELENINKGEEQ